MNPFGHPKRNPTLTEHVGGLGLVLRARGPGRGEVGRRGGGVSRGVPRQVRVGRVFAGGRNNAV